MGETVDPSDESLGAHVRLVEIPPARPDAGEETSPAPVPATTPGLAERFGEAAGDAGFRPVPPPVPAPAELPPAPAVRASLFDARIQQVIAKEGGYVNDPAV